jgi:release factor glutamine methyltransferase
MLLGHLLGHRRSWLYAHGDEHLSDTLHTKFISFAKRRESGEPLAYILGEKEFFGRTFAVDRRVMIPRPSTEGLVEMVLDVLRGAYPDTSVHELDTQIVGVCHLFGDISEIQTVVDVGTGSGCIAITLACQCPDLRFLATDLSRDALNVAKENARRHNVFERIKFQEGNLLEPLSCHPELRRRAFLVVSNPPYIPTGATLSREVRGYEPHTALFAGADGMNVLKELLSAAKTHPRCRGVIVECREDQRERFINGYHPALPEENEFSTQNDEHV